MRMDRPMSGCIHTSVGACNASLPCRCAMLVLALIFILLNINCVAAAVIVVIFVTVFFFVIVLVSQQIDGIVYTIWQPVFGTTTKSLSVRRHIEASVIVQQSPWNKCSRLKGRRERGNQKVRQGIGMKRVVKNNPKDTYITNRSSSQPSLWLMLLQLSRSHGRS